jgi:hypothetical protein
MAEETPTAGTKTEPELISIVEFFENKPPGSMLAIVDLITKEI